jgi:hypothetical protein
LPIAQYVTACAVRVFVPGTKFTCRTMSAACDAEYFPNIGTCRIGSMPFARMALAMSTYWSSVSW